MHYRCLVHGDLGGLFDGPSTVRFDPNLPMVSLDLSRISGSNQLIGLVMSCASAWMEAALADPQAGRRYVIYDEAWRLIAQPSLLARMQSQWKLSRALGIANLMVDPPAQRPRRGRGGQQRGPQLGPRSVGRLLDEDRVRGGVRRGVKDRRSARSLVDRDRSSS